MQGTYHTFERTKRARPESDETGEARRVRREAKRTLQKARAEERQRKHAVVT